MAWPGKYRGAVTVAAGDNWHINLTHVHPPPLNKKKVIVLFFILILETKNESPFFCCPSLEKHAANKCYHQNKIDYIDYP